MLTVSVTEGVARAVPRMVADMVGVLLEVEVRVELCTVAVEEGVTAQDRVRERLSTPLGVLLAEGREVELGEEEGVLLEGLVRVGVPDFVEVFEEEAVEVPDFVPMAHREGVEDTVEVLLPPMDRVPEGEPVEVLEAVVVAVEVGVRRGEGVDREDLEKEEEPLAVFDCCMDLLPQGEAEEVLDRAEEREKVGVPVEVLEEDTEAVLVEVDFPAAPTPEALGLLE